MSKIKKLLSWALVVSLTAGASVAGTMAYLTDEESNANVMTVGNVSIEQHEYERVVGADGNYEKAIQKDNKGNGDFTPNYGITEAYKLQEFSQGKAALPAVYTNAKGTTDWDEFQQLWNQVGAPGSNDLFDDSMKNVIDKFVFVENTGKTDAYYRTIIAVESPEGCEDIIHHNFNSNERFDAIEQSDDFTGEADKGYKSYFVGYTTIENVRYALFNMTYNKVLEPGEVSRPSLLQVYLDPKATNEDCAKFGATWEILVVSQAVQVNGFESMGANDALDKVFYEVTTDNNPWLGENASYVISDDINELNDALKAGKDVIAYNNSFNVVSSDASIDVDAQGATVTLNGVNDSDTYHGYFGYVAPEVTVSNLNVTGSGFAMLGMYGETAGTYTANNLVVEDVVSTLANGDKGFLLGCGFAHYGTATLNNCKMTGTTSMVDGVIPVDAGFVNDTTTTINDGEYGTIYCWSRAIVTINDAEVDYIYAAPNSKGKLTIAEGTHVGTLNIARGTMKETSLKIKNIVINGTVDNVIYEGATYTWDEWIAK